MSPIQSIDPPSLGTPNPMYSAITAAPLSPTTTLYTISGQVAEDPETGIVPSGLGPQIDLCLRRIDICLDHIGAGKSDMIRFMYYFRQGALDEYEAEAEAEAENGKGQGRALQLIVERVGKWLGGHRPASCFNRSFGMSDDRFACEFEAMVVLSKE